MTDEYTDINLNMVLRPIGSPIDKGTPFKSGFDFDTQMDREFINQVALRTDSVSTRTIQDLAVTDAKILNLTANKITAGTIDASSISVINLDADNITTGSIDASDISVYNLDAGNITTGLLDADYIDASYLSAIAADLGTVTAGSLTGGTITGGIVRTAASGSRTEMSGADNELRVYNGSNKIIQVDEGGMWVRQGNVIGLGGSTAGGQTCQIFENADISGALNITADSSIYLNSVVSTEYSLTVGGKLYVDDIDEDGQGYVEVTDDLDIDGWCAIGSWASLGGDLDMNGNDINEVGSINYACEFYAGTDYYKALETLTIPKDDKFKGDWAEMDTSKLHKAIQSKWKKKIYGRDVDGKIGKREDGELTIDEVEMTGYSLNKLVMIQARCILDLQTRLDLLESK